MGGSLLGEEDRFKDQSRGAKREGGNGEYGSVVQGRWKADISVGFPMFGNAIGRIKCSGGFQRALAGHGRRKQF